MTEDARPTALEAGSPPDPQERGTFWAARGPRGLAFAVAALIGGGVAVATLHSGHETSPRYAVVVDDEAPRTTSSDPLMAELIRCRSLPPQASDPACERAWEENRRRFFGESRAMRVPGDPMPAYAPIPVTVLPTAASPLPSAPVGPALARER